MKTLTQSEQFLLTTFSGWGYTSKDVRASFDRILSTTMFTKEDCIRMQQLLNVLEVFELQEAREREERENALSSEEGTYVWDMGVAK
jgi:hypothetical protein